MRPEGCPVSAPHAAPRIAELDQQALTAREIIDGARNREREAAIGSPDEGYFPPGSVLRQVHSNRKVGLLYGQLALTIGGTDTLNYVGTSEHTRNKQLPFRRLAETAEMFETIFLGSREEADAVVDRVFLMHTRVKGDTSEAAGPYPKNTPYSAFDSDRMLGTMTPMAYSALALYEELEQPLSDEDRESFWQDYRLFGELFGLSRDNTPETYPEFQHYMKDRFTGGELHLTDAAKYMGEVVSFYMPIPHFRERPREIMNLVLLGTLPKEVREMYDLPYNLSQESKFHKVASAIRLGSKLLPNAITHGRNTFLFKQVAGEEVRLQTLGVQAVMPENPYQ